MEGYEMSGRKIFAVKLAVISFTIIVMRLWTGFTTWVFDINIWWLVAVFVIAAWKAGCCKGSCGMDMGKGKKKKK